MMSGAGRSPDSADASAIPFASGRPMSSSTRSIGCAEAAASEAARIASRAVCTTAVIENPSSRPRYVW